SGYYYPNRLALAAFHALADVMGVNGFNAMLTLARLRNFINNYPPDDLEKDFDFADFSAIQIALEEMYGVEAGRMFIRRAGRATFAQGLKTYGAMAGVSNEAFRCLPLPVQLRIGTQALARIMSQISDQWTTVEECEGQIMFRVQQCPHCWERTGMNQGICSFGTGLLEEGLKWISGGFVFNVMETKCMAAGDELCEYTIEKQPIHGNQLG
ncbi:MAG TPA: methanogen output domain 1-containing protein, partial [Anaerolineales bacterium]